MDATDTPGPSLKRLQRLHMNYRLRMLPEHALKDRHLKGHLSERLSDVLCSGAWSPEKDSRIGNYRLPSKRQHEWILSAHFILLLARLEQTP